MVWKNENVFFHEHEYLTQYSILSFEIFYIYL